MARLPVRLPWQVLQAEIAELVQESGLPIGWDGKPLHPSCPLMSTVVVCDDWLCRSETC